MDQRQKNILLLVFTLVLVAVSVAIFWPPQTRVTQGLDIQGGLSVILTAQETSRSPVTPAAMDRVETIVRNRVDRLGASEASIQKQGNDSILIQLPGIKNAEEALKVLGSTGQLGFVAVESINDTAAVAALQAGQERVQLKEGTYEPFLTGEVITSASINTDQTGKITVNLSMNEAGSQTWAEFTSANIGKQVAIVLDGVVQSAPTVRDAITGGQTEISGNFTPEEAKNLKTVLETGALPVTLVPSESRVVGPTLGQDSLRQGLMAVTIGITLVAVYLIVFYRGLGLTSVVALAVFAAIFIGILALLSRFGLFALTLPGIAGIVLTVGIAADSSILFLERFREEIRMGKTYRSASNSATRHALGTSVDADLVTFVSALVLFLVAIGPVKGFALTLMIGIACDVLMMIVYKRPIIMLLAESTIAKAPWFWGVAVADKAPVGVAPKGGGANA